VPRHLGTASIGQVLALHASALHAFAFWQRVIGIMHVARHKSNGEGRYAERRGADEGPRSRPTCLKVRSNFTNEDCIIVCFDILTTASKYVSIDQGPPFAGVAPNRVKNLFSLFPHQEKKSLRMPPASGRFVTMLFHLNDLPSTILYSRKIPGTTAVLVKIFESGATRCATESKSRYNDLFDCAA
jgi:hypothetical protein